MARIFLVLLLSVLQTFAEETFSPYKTSKEVPKNVEECMYARSKQVYDTLPPIQSVARYFFSQFLATGVYNLREE